MQEWCELFNHTTDAVFGIDKAHRICFWNHSCERLLDRRAEEVMGFRCADVLCGTDLAGEMICGDDCPMAQPPHQNALRNFDMLVEQRRGVTFMINVGAHYVPEALQNSSGRIVAFFALRHIDCQQLIGRFATHNCRAMEQSTVREQLSVREIEVLRLAADGRSSAAIAEQLNISAATVKNHFRRIFGKLDVHSRGEAIYVAVQRRLL